MTPEFFYDACRALVAMVTLIGLGCVLLEKLSPRR